MMQQSKAYSAGDEFSDEFSIFENWDNSDFILQNQDDDLDGMPVMVWY